MGLTSCGRHHWIWGERHQWSKCSIMAIWPGSRDSKILWVAWKSYQVCDQCDGRLYDSCDWQKVSGRILIFMVNVLVLEIPLDHCYCGALIRMHRVIDLTIPSIHATRRQLVILRSLIRAALLPQQVPHWPWDVGKYRRKVPLGDYFAKKKIVVVIMFVCGTHCCLLARRWFAVSIVVVLPMSMNLSLWLTRMMIALSAHDSGAYAISYDPEKQLLFTGGKRGEIGIYRMKS